MYHLLHVTFYTITFHAITFYTITFYTITFHMSPSMLSPSMLCVHMTSGFRAKAWRACRHMCVHMCVLQGGNQAMTRLRSVFKGTQQMSRVSCSTSQEQQTLS